MKKWFRKLSAALVLSAILAMTFGTSVFAANSAKDPRFDIAGGIQFTMHAGETKEIYWFCDADYKVFTTENTSSKTALMASGKLGNNNATIYIGADEQSSRVVFYLYPQDDMDNYERIIVDVLPAAAAQAAAPLTAYAANGIQAIIYDAYALPRAAFAVVGKNGLEQLSIGAFVKRGNGVYLTVNTPSDTAASIICVSPTDKAAAQAVGVSGLVLNGKVINWP